MKINKRRRLWSISLWNHRPKKLNLLALSKEILCENCNDHVIKVKNSDTDAIEWMHWTPHVVNDSANKSCLVAGCSCRKPMPRCD